MSKTTDLITPLPSSEHPRLRGEPDHKVVYLVHDASMKDGRIGLGVYSSLDRAKRACQAQSGSPLVSIRAALVDGAVAFAQDSV